MQARRVTRLHLHSPNVRLFRNNMNSKYLLPIILLSTSVGPLLAAPPGGSVGSTAGHASANAARPSGPTTQPNPSRSSGDAAASPSPAALAAANEDQGPPDAVKKARLTRLKNQVGLKKDQEAKAKPTIDKYIDDKRAAKGNAKKLSAIKTKFDVDIDAILTPAQRSKLAASNAAIAAKAKATTATNAATTAAKKH
jgi:hypothetical protein